MLKLRLTKVQLMQRLHDLLKFSKSRPILITSKSYIEFMERHYGQKIYHHKPQA